MYGRFWLLPPSKTQQMQGELYGAVRFDGAYRNGDLHPILVETGVPELVQVHFLPPTEISFCLHNCKPNGGHFKAHPEALQQQDLVGAFSLDFTQRGGFLNDLWHTFLTL